MISKKWWTRIKYWGGWMACAFYMSNIQYHMYFFIRYFTLDFIMKEENEIHPAVQALMVGLGIFMLCR